MLDTYIQDTFGKRYVIKRQSDLSSNKSFKALNFSDENQAYQFIHKLRTPQDYWLKTVSKLGTFSTRQNTPSKLHAERLICRLLCRKQLFIYELSGANQGGSSAVKRSIKKASGDTYTFIPVSSLLIAQPRELVNVNTKADAEKLLNELSPDEVQLKEIYKELNISSSDTGSQSTEKLVAAIVSGDIVVAINKPLASPPTRETETEVATADKPAELSPDAGVVTVNQAAPADPMSNINQKPQADTLVKASDEGTPFCEECEKAKEENKSHAA